MNDCLFCKIRDGEIPSRSVFRDDQCFVFRDIKPQAPTHVLIVPHRHIATLNDLTSDDEPLLGHLLGVARQIAVSEKIAERGWRTVFNVNQDAGQTVFHVHLHLLGGRSLSWPPG